MTRAARLVILALFIPLLTAVNPIARADFYNSYPLPMAEDVLYGYFDQSSDGQVIIAVEGCKLCELYRDPGYAYLSLNGGTSFSELTSLGQQQWKGAEVSNDGTKIALFTTTNFYISSNSGSSFTRVDALPFDYITSGKEITAGAMSNDGLNIFIGIRFGYFMKFNYNSNLKRWTSTISSQPTNADIVEIATSYDGSKTYFIEEWTSIRKLVGTIFSTLPNTNGTWDQIRTSDSGNEIMALSNGVAYKSLNVGASFSAITSVGGHSLGLITAIEISANGNASFFSEAEDQYFGPSYIRTMTLYTQHGKTATWYPRESLVYHDIQKIRTDYEGTIVLTGNAGAPLRTMNGAPNPPKITGVSTASPSSINIDWGFEIDPGLDPGQAISDIVIEYATSNSGPWTNFSDGVSGGNSGTITVTGLAARTDYYFRIKAVSSYGTSVYSQTSVGSIFEKPDTPNAPTRLNNLDSVLDIQFNTPSDLGGANAVTDEEWQYSSNSGSTWNSSSSRTFNAAFVFDGFTGAKYLTISEVIPGTTMSVRSRVSNGLLWSDWSAATSTTFYGKPSAPENFQASTVYTTASLSWSPSTYLGGHTVTGYRYAYSPANTNNWIEDVTTSTSATITGLVGGSAYDFYVATTTVRGVSSHISYFYNSLAVSPPSKLGFNRSSSGAKSGVALSTQPKISLLNSSNNVVTDDSKSIVYAEVNKGGRLVGIESATAISGIATFSNLGLSGLAGTQYAITYRSGSLTPVTETVTLQAGTKSSIKFLRNTVGGVNNAVFPTQAQFEILDSTGNRVTSDETTTISMSSSVGFLWDGSVTTPEARASQGVVTFSGVRITGGNGASSVLTYSSSGLADIQETITITTGAASTFTRVVRAADGYIGGKFGTQPTYKVTDSAGNFVSTGDFFVTLTASQGTLTGRTTVKVIDGVATFTDLGIKDVGPSQLVILSAASDGFMTYTGDSIITRPGVPRLSSSNLYIPRTSSAFEIPTPDSSTAGTFTYTSSNSSVISISGSTATVVGAGTATITATFTPSDTSSYVTGETVTSTFTVSPGAGTLVVALSGGSTVAKGVIKTITATASDAGTVTFLINGKRVPGCIGVKTQSSVATCNWKPNAQGGATLTAILIPTDSQINPVTSGALGLSIGRRTGRR